MLNPKTNVGKLKMASSLPNLHISKVAAKLKKKLSKICRVTCLGCQTGTNQS